jgi:hypothetical protein
MIRDDGTVGLSNSVECGIDIQMFLSHDDDHPTAQKGQNCHCIAVCIANILFFLSMILFDALRMRGCDVTSSVAPTPTLQLYKRTTIVSDPKHRRQNMIPKQLRSQISKDQTLLLAYL